MREPAATETQEERGNRIRKRALDALPSWYSPWGHLLVTTGTGVVMLALGLVYVHHVRPLEWLVPPVVFVMANLFEWRAHKHILHRRRRFLEIIYDRHTPVHHMVFTEHNMTIREPRELRLVLIPAAGVVGIVLGLAPVAALAGFLITPNAGWLMLVTAALYMVTYELSHTSYHLPEDSFVGRLRLVRVLRKHHAKHHDPELMQQWNFNVTVPLWDWLLGTIAPAVVENAASAPTANPSSKKY